MERAKIHQSCSKVSPPSKRNYKISAAVNSILQLALNLSPKEFFVLSCELIKKSSCDFDQRRMLKNLVVDSFKSDCKAKKDLDSHVEQEVEDFTGQRSNVDPSTSRSLVEKPSIPASQVPLICRGDLIAKTEIMFFDTEKVSESKTHLNVSGDFAVVDRNGNLLLWCYLNRKEEDVCKYNTKMTGLTPEKLRKGLEPQEVKAIIEKTLQGKVLYGAASKQDMLSLGLNHQQLPFVLKDIQEFYQDENQQPISLARLSKHFLGENMQETTHSSITDARLTAICYRRMERMKELGFIRFECPNFKEEQRETRKKFNPGWDTRCTCGTVNKKYKAKQLKKKGFSEINFNMMDFD